MKTILAMGFISFLFGAHAAGCDPSQQGVADSRPGTSKTTSSAPRYSRSGYDITPLSRERIAEIVKTLTPEQVEITQNGGTELACTGQLLNEKKPGIYVSVVGGLPLFRSKAKFDSKTGWPSFFEPFDPDHILEIPDDSHGMQRIELRDARSGAHLGHVFDDGPPPSGRRYCINSASLKFIPDGDPVPDESKPVATETAYFAGGCFWGVEDVFEQIPGVLFADSGYMGGKTANPTYQQVCSHTTGHAETVKVVYDPARVTYADLLKIFFMNHDATQLDRQGPDVGDQYRSAIFTANDGQRKLALATIEELQKSGEYAGRKIVTRIEPAQTFYRAEEYHQDYYKKNGGSCRVKR
jgi:peptide methionine sulfoxide reductase msrA/msrB